MPTLLARAVAPLFGSAPWPTAEPVTSRRVPLWAHAVLWGVLLLTDALQFQQILHTLSSDEARSWELWQNVVLRSLVTDALYAGIFYLNWRELIPRLLARGQVVLYALSVVLLLALFVGLRLASFHWVYTAVWEKSMKQPTLLQLAVPYALMGLMMAFLSSALKVTGDYLQERRNRRELERRQLLTELSLLKMQVNPHFLFNTLNNIYALASQKSDRAPEAVLRLAEIMRYMLYESAADTVPLSQELQHLRSFLALQQLRLPATGGAAILFDDAGLPAAAEWPVAPMLLLPLVENAFKHGDLTARPAVQIRLELTAAGALQLVVDNAVAPEPGGAALEASGGVGLVNLRRRLELLYPGRHELRLETPPGHYRASLRLLPGPALS
ncbi:sensor histidine kinase [Hymenobacter sp. 15J16-1T3B]|uniref:sensor histidine kinase n=1 Tax=Hymenobacter sp. 15J16-1T3B TaxID=2886941 RepID=UPI001D10972B|nr:histidine kinase [Hymenobacter sp. 15J16-1T3B]MCC3157806.1 sensor histidine kinase [Hymenobacter sp. 15J16-1T3B]